MAELFLLTLTGAGFVLFTVALVLTSYFVTRRLLMPGAEGDRTHDVAASVAVRIATLHALILGLVYAQELDDYKSVRGVLTEEAVAVSDVYNDARRYGGAVIQPVQQGLARYLKIVVDQEWQRLGAKKGLSPEAWQEWEGVYGRILDLSPVTEREKFLSQRMKVRITDVARHRQLRQANSMGRFAGLFWGPALIGLILVAAPFYVYRPTRTHVVLLSLFGAYSGVIFFFIFAFANPFSAPGKLEPKPFEHLLRGEIGQTLKTP